MELLRVKELKNFLREWRTWLAVERRDRVVLFGTNEAGEMRRTRCRIGTHRAINGARVDPGWSVI
jgi:hypothetical protein